MLLTRGPAGESIEAQDFCALDDKTGAQFNYPLRLPPASSMAWAGVGTALAAPATLCAVAVGLLSFSNLGNGMELDPDKALHDWQVRRLMDPSPQELETERMGNVYIYDGLTELEVDTALNTHFSRIQHMMFVGW